MTACVRRLHDLEAEIAQARALRDQNRPGPWRDRYVREVKYLVPRLRTARHAVPAAYR